MNSSCTQTDLVIDGLFALLACRICKETPERPIRFVTCGHFFCDKCVENDDVCPRCRTRVQSSSKQPDPIVSQLVSYCRSVKEMISDLDDGGLCSLANAIHQITTECSERQEESVLRSDKIVEPTQPPRKAPCGISDPETSRHNNSTERDRNCQGNVQQIDNANSVTSLEINQKREKANPQLENANCARYPQTRQQLENSEPCRENKSFVETSQTNQRNKENTSQHENTSFVNSLQIIQRQEENISQHENTSFVNSSQNSERYDKRNSLPENSSFVESSQIDQRLEDNIVQVENLSFVESSQTDRRPKNTELCPENVSFVHSTQIIRRPRDGDAESETPGYIDPTQFSPILKEVDSESETPGYRDPSQVIQSIVDSETPGYRDPTQISQQLREQYSESRNDESTIVPVERYKPKTGEKKKKYKSTSWREEMELEVDDKDLFSPVPDTSDDDLSAPPSPEMEVSFSEDDIIPETLDEEPDTHVVQVAPTASHQKNSSKEIEQSNQDECPRRIRRETFSGSDCNDTGFVGKNARKARTRLHRRLTDPEIDSCSRDPTVDFDGLSVPSVSEPFMEYSEENEIAPLRKLRRMDRKRFGVNENTRKITDSCADGEDLIKPHMRDVPTVVRRNSFASEPDTVIVESSDGSEMERAAPPKKLGRIANLRLNRETKNSANSRDKLDVVRLRDFPSETEELFESENVQRVGLETTIDTLPFSDIQASPMETSEIPANAEPGLTNTRFLIGTESKNRDALGIDGTKIAFNGGEKEKGSLKILRRIRDLKSNRQSNTRIEAPENRGANIIGDSASESEKISESGRADKFERIKNLAMARLSKDSLSDRDTLDLANGGDLAETTDYGAEYDPLENTIRVDNTRNSTIGLTGSSNNAPPRQLTRLTNWPLNRRDSDTIDDSDTVSLANDEEMLGEFAKSTIRPLRQLKGPQKSKTIDRTIRQSDIRELDITNIHDFGKSKLQIRPPMDDSDTVDVAGIGDTLVESEAIPLRPLDHRGDARGGNHTVMASDIRDIDITNIQDFGEDKLRNKFASRVSDTAGVADATEGYPKPEELPKTRPLRQLRRLENSMQAPKCAIVSDSHGVNIMDISRFDKVQVPMAGKIPATKRNFSLKRPSRSPPNDDVQPQAAAAGTEDQNSVEPFRNVENVEIDTQNKLPAKKAKAKVVQLKPRRRALDNSTTAPKAVPKNVNKRNVKGETVLHTACVKGQKEYVRDLLEAGAIPNTKDHANWTPLQEVVKLGWREICEMLLQFGASPNTPGIENRTALHDAAQNDKLEEAALLLRFNADRDVYDTYGKRPIDYAVSDAMRNLLAGDSAAEEVAVDAAPLNATMDQSLLTPNAKVVVLPSNLGSENKKALSKIASKLKITVAATFRPGVTHVVVEANERNTTELTYNIMLAILQGIWILNSQWIAISMDLDDITEIDLELFEVHGVLNPGTPERSRMNEEKQNPRLFNNCFFYFTIGARGTWDFGKLEFTKAKLTALVLAGQGEVLKRLPDPEDVKHSKITPFHVANKPIHPLHRCAHYIIYMPGKDEPRIKYNMPHIKTLPLAWFVECIEKFALVDPMLIGIS